MCTLRIEEESHDYNIFDGIFRRYKIIDVYIPVWYTITIFTTVIIHMHTAIIIALLSLLLLLFIMWGVLWITESTPFAMPTFRLLY